MATEYGPQVTQMQDLQSNRTPEPGVVGGSGIASGIADLFDFAADSLKAKKSSDADKAVGEFAQRQLLVAKALEQGKIRSSANARTLMRKNLLDAIEMNPALAGDYVRIQSGLMSLGGAAQVVDEGTQAEQRQQARYQQLIDKGYAAYDASDEELNQVDQQVRTMEAAKRVYDEQMQTIDMQLKSDTLAESKRKRLEQKKKDATLRYLEESAPAELNTFQNTLNQIITSQAPEAEKVAAMEDLWARWQSEARSTLGTLNEREATYLKKPFEMIYEASIKRARGEETDAEMRRKIDRAITTAEMTLTVNNPELANMAAATKLFDMQGTDYLLQTGNVDLFRKYLNNVANGSQEGGRVDVYDSSSTKKGTEQYFKSVEEALNSSDEETRAEGETNLVNILRSTETLQGILADDPMAGREIVKWMSTTGFLKARQGNSALFANVDGAKEVIGRNYDQEVWGMVQREFRDGKVNVSLRGQGPQDFADTDTLVMAESTTSGVNFVAIDNTNKRAVGEARRLNKELKPIINETIRAAAHLNGETNYQQVWESVSEQFLSGTISTEMAGGDVGDNLNPQDFIDKIESMESLGGTVGNVVEAGAGYTVVRTNDGTVERRTGTRAWRNNNPGNIEYGKFAKSQGAVGSDGRFAVFPSYEAGRKAKETLLFESSSYRNKSIADAIARYAPAFENDTQAYAKSVARSVGVTVNTILSTLDPEQRSQMLDAMERVEGFREGTVKIISQ